MDFGGLFEGASSFLSDFFDSPAAMGAAGAAGGFIAGDAEDAGNAVGTAIGWGLVLAAVVFVIFLFYKK